MLEETWQRVDQLDTWGYPFPVDETGTVRRGSLQGRMVVQPEVTPEPQQRSRHR